ncbi:MAG TPA: ABC transporter ATP-binding protein [Streptosporangiaceae bacterium]|nr:ABC transporter ATP-binding protein [Streptosporangiaceae bacterium]
MRAFLRPYRLPLSLAGVLAVAETAIGLAQPWPLQVAVDNAIGGRPPRGWAAPLAGLSAPMLGLVAAVAAVTLVAVGGVIGYLTSYLSGAAAERIGADMRSAVFGRLLDLSPRFHDRNRSGDLVTRLTGDVGHVQDALVAWFVTVLPEVLTLAGMAVVIVVIDPAMGAASFAVLPGLAVLTVFRRRRMRSARRRARARQGQLAARAGETVRHIRAVQAFGQQAAERDRFRTDNVRLTEAQVYSLDVESRYGPAADLLLAAGAGFVLWIGVLRVTSGQMSLGVLLVVLSYLGSLYGPVRSLTRLASTMARGAASRERLAAVLASTDRVAERPGAVPAPAFTAAGLSVRDVSFGYAPRTPVLKNVSLTLRPGEKVCLVGPSGAGKSTLLSLLVRLYDPGSGLIELDGVDLRHITLTSLRERIGLVPQDPWILDGTIADNIAFGRPTAARDEVVAAARLALVDGFVRRQPDGYDTVVGEGGVMLSGGQRRRIAIARALLRGSVLLLLDEPTSGLDAAAERAVLESIQRACAGRGLLMISHRLHLTAQADRVVVMEAGRVVEEGAPGELLERGGAFARLWSLQHGSALGGEHGPGAIRSLPYGGERR